MKINGQDYDIRPEANLSGANLSGAILTRADLTRADLTRANLREADLSGANFTGADLYQANLSEAILSGANFTGADLTGADLTGADLSGANLYRANLYQANLSGANLYQANLNPIKHDLWAILNYHPHEVAGVQAALREGRTDGALYEGECACLIGTIANIRRCSYKSLLVAPDSDRPAERWFFAITRGDTPETSPIAKITDEWITEWLALPVARLALDAS